MNRESYLWDGTGEPDEDVERLEELLGAYRSTAGTTDDAYLWDGSGEPDADVAHLEGVLAVYRSNAEVPDVQLPVQPGRHPSVVAFRPRTLAVRLLPFAAAAAIAAVAIGGTGIWVASQEPETHQVRTPAPPPPPVPDTGGGTQRTGPSDEAVNVPTPVVDDQDRRRPASRRHTGFSIQVAHGAPPAGAAPTVLPVPDRAPSTAARRVSNEVDPTTAMHLEQAQILLRSFRNTAPDDTESLAYESRRSRELLTRNILLRRSAVSQRDLPAYSVLSDIEPYLLDIANLDARAPRGDVQTIQDRVERSAIVAGVQLYARSGPAAGY